MNLVKVHEQFIKFLRKNNHAYSNTRFAHGDCYYYAYAMSKILESFNQKHDIYSYYRKDLKSGHCFIKMNGSFFDSENVYKPVVNYRNLQNYMKKTRNLIKHKNKNTALKHWKAKEDKAFFDKMVSLFLKEVKNV